MDEQTPHPVVCLLDNQYRITDKGGTMRLGSYPCMLKEGSQAALAYGSAEVHEAAIATATSWNNRYRGYQLPKPAA